MDYPACLFGGDHAGDAYAVRSQRGATIAGLCEEHKRSRWDQSPRSAYHLRTWQELAERKGSPDANKHQRPGVGGVRAEAPRGEGPSENPEDTGVYHPSPQERTVTSGDDPGPDPQESEAVSERSLALGSRGEDHQDNAPGHDHDSANRTSPLATPQGQDPVGKEIAPVGAAPSPGAVRATGVADRSFGAPFAWWQGAGELVLEDWQRDILQAPFDLRLVKWNYNGEHYVPWVNYWKRLLEAFAPAIPALVPLGEPKIHGDTVSLHYVMLVNGQFIGEATGEMAKKGGNKAITYARCVEGCCSDAITRIGKRLGMGLELWDPETISVLERGKRSA